MARIDKTQSAVGVVRAVLLTRWADADLDRIIGVGLDSQGRVVKGAGQTGIIGVVNPSKTHRAAGLPVDVFVLGDAVDIGRAPGDPTLAAGRAIWADGTTGELGMGVATTGAAPAAGAGSSANSVKVGFTVEADHLIIRL